MIDTDKYEGHTPAPWNIIMPTMAYDNIKIVFDTISYDEYTRPVYDWITIASLLPSQKRNAQLIADAPLLLAEVMRLREALITVQQSLVWDEKDRAMDGDPITLEALVAQVEQVRSDITEMR